MLPKPCLYAAYGPHKPRTGEGDGRRTVCVGRPRQNAEMKVAQPRDPGASPVVLLHQLQELIGTEAVARWCADLLTGTARPDDPSLPPLGWFGTGAATLLQRGDLETSDQGYWVRVWAARGLLHGWDESAAELAVPAVVTALRDDAWRVREMAAKVVRRWQLEEAAKAVTALRKDDVPRVRAAAERAMAQLADTAGTSRPASQSRRPAAQSRARSAAVRSSTTTGASGVAKGTATKRKTGKSPGSKASRPERSKRRRKPVGVDDLDTAVNEAVTALRRGADRDWSKAAGPLSWDCGRTCVHIADDLIAYATQLAGRVTSGYLPFRLTPSRGTAPEGLLNLVAATGALLGAAAQAAPADARGWHGHGVADAEGFLAMGIGELIVHTHDIAAGLKLAYEPDVGVSERVVARMFPDVLPDNESPYALLLWCTGRRDLPGREPVKRWRWSPAPAE